MTLPRGCPRVELALKEDRSQERDLDALKSRRGERMIFEGASECVCSQPVEAKDRPASTLVSCLVQPCCCNPELKKAAQTKRQKSRRSESNREKEEKTLLRRYFVY
jgi:hypothetical protein